MTLLDEAFALLDRATTLEHNASQINSNTSRCESAGEASSSESFDYSSLLEQAASKYHEACYLMKRHVGRTNGTAGGSSDEAVKMRKLLVGKIEHYELHAEELKRRAAEHKLQLAEKSEIQSKSAQVYPGFTLERNVSPNTSWENKHSSQLESTLNTGQSQMAKRHPNIIDSSTSTHNEAAVQSAGKAAVLLSTAIKLDESGDVSKAIKQYLASAQHYLEAVKVLSEHKTKADLVTSLKHKIQSALNRVEELKKRQKPDCDEIKRKLAALDAMIKDHSSNEKKKPDCDEITRKLASLEPMQKDTLSSYEVDVLKRSSLISSGLFLPWCDEEAKTYNFSPSSSPWVDPDGTLALSDKQKQRFYKWARPSEIIQMKMHSSNDITMIHSITPFTIKQYCVSDCSFVAGLCIAAAYERRFKKRIVSSLIYPQDSSGYPIYNPSGVYMVKLWLNGCVRRVLVDDLLPVDKKGKLLCSHTDNALSRSKRQLMDESVPLELWVPILEKAYMKLCGGYDFPGSNSGVDMFSLTGWIPERIFFPEDVSNVQDFETPIERAWERLYSANSYGDCLITLSTSKELTEEKAAEVGLFTDHAYSVLGVIQTTDGTRLLQLKNPWAAEGWKGVYSSNDRISWSDPRFCAEVGYNATSSDSDDGVFYMSWDDVTMYCSNLHLSWNPSLFRHKYTVHGVWKKEVGPVDDAYNVGENPQYVVTLSTNATLWILLSRHVTKQEQECGEVSDFLTLHIHRLNPRKDDRIWYPQGSILTGAYTNNPHVLVRYDVEDEADKSLALVLSQYQKSNDLCYTLSCYCTEKFKLSQPNDPLPYCHTMNASWELRGSAIQNQRSSLHIGTAGGSPGKGSFGSNPQWTFAVGNDTVVQLKCMAKKTLAVNVILVQTGSGMPSSNQKPNSKRIHHLYERPIIDSGDYRYGFVVTKRTLLRAGLYTLVASTFEVGQEGKFILHVLSDRVVDIHAIK